MLHKPNYGRENTDVFSESYGTVLKPIVDFITLNLTLNISLIWTYLLTPWRLKEKGNIIVHCPYFPNRN
jgi:hypothetical protein